MFKNGLWLFGLTVLLLLMFLPAFGRLQEKINRNKELDAKLIEMRAQKKELIEEKRRLEDDPAYLEKVGREKMGLVKEGEVIYRIESADSPDVVEKNISNKEVK